MWVDDYNDIYLAGEVFNGNSDSVEINAIAGSLADETGKLVTASYANHAWIMWNRTEVVPSL
jgi:hypothetical protein